MRRKNLLRLFICAPLLLGACGGGPSDNATNTAATANSTSANATAAPAPAATPQKQPVTATVEEATLDAGGKGEASVRLDIAQGFHVHANPASDKFFIATEVRAEPQEGLTPGKPVYPKPVSKKLSFSEKPLALYEGSVVIKLPLTAAKDATKGRHTLRARVRVQPCDDTACQPPREIDAPIPVTVN
ncbi:MAG TPA: protein-disulfide reductase DsbD domain-containing protein [Pyrinomonadaceae bacterium]|nr:protein-disulfide reductase DsbD domain-containing protein [Pyrinomonadaceae bacterium]